MSQDAQKDAITDEISRLPFFSIMTPEEREEIAGIMILMGMKAGQTVLSETDPGDACYFLLEGKVDVIKKVRDGEELLLDTLDAPTILGELSLITNQPRSASIVCRTGVRLLKLPKFPFHQMIIGGRVAAYKVIYRIATALGYRLATLDGEIIRLLKETEQTFEEKLKSYQEAKGTTMDKWPL